MIMTLVSDRVSPRVLARYGTILGAAMTVCAVVLTGILRGKSLAGWFPVRGGVSGVALGTLAGTAFALAAWYLLHRIPALQRIENLLITTLDMPALTYKHAVLFSLMAGVPEEILFRGAIQPVLGLVLTSALFGALHTLTPAYFVYATGAGGLLGGLAILSNGLWAPVAAHTVIDLIMFVFLIRSWRSSQPPLY